MDSHFLQDVFEAAIANLRKSGKGPYTTAHIEAALRAAAAAVTASRMAAMENAVKSNHKELVEIVAEWGTGKLPRVNFDYDRITRHASTDKVASDDHRWKN